MDGKIWKVWLCEKMNVAKWAWVCLVIHPDWHLIHLCQCGWCGEFDATKAWPMSGNMERTGAWKCEGLGEPIRSGQRQRSKIPSSYPNSPGNLYISVQPISSYPWPNTCHAHPLVCWARSLPKPYEESFKGFDQSPISRFRIFHWYGIQWDIYNQFQSGILPIADFMGIERDIRVGAKNRIEHFCIKWNGVNSLDFE